MPVPTAQAGLLSRLTRGDRMADLLIVLIVLYTAFVLTPVFEIPDFQDLELSSEIAASAESNPINQLFWFAGTALGLLATLPDWRARLVRMAAGNLWLFGLIGLGLVSVLWALEPGVALRRAVQQSMIVFCITAAVGGARSLDRLLMMIYLGFAIAMAVHMAAIPLPKSYNSLHEFRGFFSDKNGLGGLAAVAILFGGAIRSLLVTKGSRLLNLLYLAGWGGILVLSISKTSMALVVVIPVLYMAMNLISRATRLGVGVYFALVPVIGGAALVFLIFGMGIAPASIVGLISPDVTFTGRTTIWQFVVDSLQGHWLLGFGFHSFWSIGSLAPNLAAQDHFIRLLNQAHNGFLDLILSVGLAGLGLLLCAFVQAAASMSRIRARWPVVHCICWMLLIFSLIHNMSESSFFRGYSPPWLFLLFAMLIPARAVSEGYEEMPDATALPVSGAAAP